MNIFAYGTLLFPEVIEQLTARRFPFEDVSVQGFERRTLAGKIYPGIFDCPGKQLNGRIYFNLDADSLRILDLFEDEIYERRQLVLQSAAQGRVVALAYVIPPELRDVLSATFWEPEEFAQVHLLGYLERCAELRTEILTQLQKSGN